MRLSRRCDICDDGPLKPPRQWLEGVFVCAHCYDKPVLIRTAAIERLKARTFYVSSISQRGDTWTVKRFRQRMTCNCPDFTHRGQVLDIPCKHVRLVRLLARAAGGFRQVPHGLSLRFRLSDKRKAVAHV